MSIIFSKHHSQKPYVPIHHQQHSISTYCLPLPFQCLFYLPFNSKPASFQSPLLIQLLPLPCCHGYTFSPESRKLGGGQECEKERGAVNGGGVKTAQRWWGRREGKIEAQRSGSLREETRGYQTRGGSSMCSLLWQQIPTEYCWFHYLRQSRYLAITDTDRTGGKFAVLFLDLVWSAGFTSSSCSAL